MTSIYRIIVLIMVSTSHATTGYDFAGALPGLQNGYEGVGEEKLFEENNKKFDVLAGKLLLQKIYIIYYYSYVCFIILSTYTWIFSIHV